MTVQTALASAAELSNWLDNSIRNLETPPYGNREWVAATLFDLVHEHHQAIQVLLRSSLYGSAFSLFRSIFETYVRGVWLLRCASEEEVENFIEDVVNKSLPQLIREVEQQPGYEVGVLSKVYKKAFSPMCSYTHGGSFQTARRITLGQIKPNYSEGEKLEVINSSSTFALLAASEIFSMANRNDLNEGAVERMRRLSDDIRMHQGSV